MCVQVWIEAGKQGGSGLLRCDVWKIVRQQETCMSYHLVFVLLWLLLLLMMLCFCVEDLRLVFWGVGGRRWRTGRPARTMLCCDASLQFSRHLKKGPSESGLL